MVLRLKKITHSPAFNGGAVAMGLLKMLKAFHACKNSGNDDFIIEKTPFLSKHNSTSNSNHDRKWLTTGYYFWLDSKRHAEGWSYNNKNGNVIVEFELNLSYGNKYDIFDLAGNAEHQEIFSNYMEQYKERRDAAAKKKGRQLSKLVVSEIIEAMRKNGDFAKFKSIKCNDDRNSGITKISFDDDRLSMPIGQAFQICVFENNKGLIKFKKIIHRGLRS